MIGCLLLCFALVSVTTAATRPLDDIVPDYMEGDLETAIIPTPKRARLADSCVVLEKPAVCVAPRVLVEAAEVLDATDLAQKRRDVLSRTFSNVRERRRAARQAFGGAWESASAKVQNRPGRPDLLATVMEIRDVFPDCRFVTDAPDETDAPVLHLIADDLNPNVADDAGVDVPSLPEVEDELSAEERYAVLSATDDGRPVAVSRGANIWGALWGVQTLRQMVFEHEDRLYLRQGRVEDWPTLWFRGGKRCRDWWVRYKGNGRFENWPFRYGMRHVPRSHSHWVSGKPARVKRHREALRKAVERGAGWLLLDFNDGRFWTSDKEDEPFPGDPAKTVRYLLDELKKERERLGSDIRLGYMPVGYAINRGSDREARMLREVDALDGVEFLMMNGLEVHTYRFPHQGAAAYREAFGADCKLLMYDCQSLRRPMRTPDYHDDQVYKHLHGISAQGASPVFFIGLADYTWSPETYDPDRALRLAARELADRDPERYRALLDYMLYYAEHSSVDEMMPREETLRLYKRHTDGMVERLEDLEPVLEGGRMAAVTDLAGYIKPPVRRRADAWDQTKQHGFKTYRVGRAGEITLDGNLDEPEWQAAPKMDNFFPAPQIKGLDDKPLPADGRSIVARALHGDGAFYVSYEVTGVSEEMMDYVRGSVEGDLVEKNPKKKPVFEMFVKPELGRVVRWQLMHFVPEGHATHVLHYFDPDNPFAANHVTHDPEIACSVTGKNSYAVEVRVPFWEGIDPPKSGDVWGVQLQMNRALAHRGTPYWLYHWTYAHDRRGLWAFEYPYGRWQFD